VACGNFLKLPVGCVAADLVVLLLAVFLHSNRQNLK